MLTLSEDLYESERTTYKLLGRKKGTMQGGIYISGGGDNERPRVALNQPLFTQWGDDAIKPIRSITILVVPDYLGVYIAIYAT